MQPNVILNEVSHKKQISHVASFLYPEKRRNIWNQRKWVGTGWGVWNKAGVISLLWSENTYFSKKKYSNDPVQVNQILFIGI